MALLTAAVGGFGLYAVRHHSHPPSSWLTFRLRSKRQHIITINCRVSSQAAAAAYTPPAVGGLAATEPQRRRCQHRPKTALACGPLCQEGWPLWTAFAICAALGQVVERRTPLGAVLSAPLVSMLLALAAAAMGLVPTASGAADAIWTYLMPLGAALYLLECDLTQLLSSAGATLAAFLVGAVGTVIGTIVAFKLLGPQLGPGGYKVAAALCASYIGGSINFAAVSRGLGFAPGPVLAGAMAADNCAMALYTFATMAIPAKDQRAAAAAAAGGQSGAPGSSTSTGRSPTATIESLALSVAAAAMACTLGERIAAAAGMGSSGLAVMALLASGIAMLASKLAALFSGRQQQQQQQQQAMPFGGAEALGGALMMLFFATIGAAAGSLQALKGCGWLVLFILLQLSIHLAICLAAGRFLHLPMQAILIASNANVGGPATAAAMASAKGWQHMIQPAVLTGSLGYSIATSIGLCMGQWLQGWYTFV